MLAQHDHRTVISVLRTLRAVVRCNQYAHAFELLQSFNFTVKVLVSHEVLQCLYRI
jgi:hypothetical protein